MNSQPSIELHIEELVLHGFSHGDRHRIAEALQGEVSRLLTDPATHGSLATSREAARLDGGSFPMAANANPTVVGAQVARSLHRGLQQMNAAGSQSPSAAPSMHEVPLPP